MHAGFAPTALAGVAYRDIEEVDLPAVRQLQYDLFPVKYSDAFYESLIRGKRGMLTLLAHEEDTGMLVGIVTARVQKMPNIKGSVCEGYIATLGVHASFRSRGLGANLLVNIEKLLAFRTNVPRMRLHVKVDNEAAIRLYKKQQFDVVQRLEQHYHFDDAYHDAYELVKWIHDPDLYCIEGDTVDLFDVVARQAWCLLL